jgi:hypothetical protein
MMNVLIFILAYDVQSAMTVAYDLDERVSSHGEKKMYLRSIVLWYARISAFAQNRNR